MHALGTGQPRTPKHSSAIIAEQTIHSLWSVEDQGLFKVAFLTLRYC